MDVGGYGHGSGREYACVVVDLDMRAGAMCVIELQELLTPKTMQPLV